MTDSTRSTSFEDASPGPCSNILISRMIDGEASSEDVRMFERLAESQPHLWRELALRHRDATALTASVERGIEAAVEVDLPVRMASWEESRTHRGPWLLASAGWAAALLLAVAWYFSALPAAQGPTGAVVRTAQHTTPEDQLRSYLQAPFVLGELDPIMEQLDPLPDGRVAVVALRRIQEVVFLDDPNAIPVDDEWHFLKDPAELRAATH